MSMHLDIAPLVPILPLLAFGLVLLVGSRLPARGAIPTIAATGGSLGISLYLALAVAGGRTGQRTIYQWATGEEVAFSFGILIDPLSTLMLVIVALIAFLVSVFSLGYMNGEGETGLPRYYSSLGLFTFSMLAFVIADNLLMAFMFFELVGLCSYLLIGFWFRTASAASAAKKAFLVTRFGDYFLLVGVVAIAATYGTLAFAGDTSIVTAAESAKAADAEHFGVGASTWVTLTALLLLGGVVGKSAQFPLHTWLPDAMEGPTTVSALIHAATMVAAGVYLVARLYGYFALSPTALTVVAFIGGFTALFAASMALVKDDIKQVLAYSTISQYGYMMLGLGVGGYVAGVFHLMNHAFFKALLFLGAGAVIVLVHHRQDMWEMGGLRRKSPITYWTFLAGALALAGVAPLSGFWSKDEILYDALIVGVEQPAILLAFAMGLVAVFLTGLYTARMVILTFHGEPRSDAATDTHAIGWSIKAPLVVLGILSVVAGAANLAPLEKLAGIHATTLHDWLAGEYGVDPALEGVTAAAYEAAFPLETGYVVSEAITVVATAGTSLALAVGGLAVGWWLYAGPDPTEPAERFERAYTLLRSNYYQDEYQVWLAEGVAQPLSSLADRFDQVVIDGAVNGTGTIGRAAGRQVARLQSGVVTNYVALLVAGLLALLVAGGLLGGWFPW